MNVTLAASPIFYFPVSRALVKQLMALSKTHYDGECQRASARVGTTLRPGSSLIQKENGILTIWYDRFERDVHDSSTVEVRASWDQLDLISKICENPTGLQGRSYSLISHFRGQLSRMIAFAGPKITKEWKVEFTV